MMFRQDASNNKQVGGFARRSVVDAAMESIWYG